MCRSVYLQSGSTATHKARYIHHVLNEGCHTHILENRATNICLSLSSKKGTQSKETPPFYREIRRRSMRRSSNSNTFKPKLAFQNKNTDIPGIPNQFGDFCVFLKFCSKPQHPQETRSHNGQKTQKPKHKMQKLKQTRQRPKQKAPQNHKNHKKHTKKY